MDLQNCLKIFIMHVRWCYFVKKTLNANDVTVFTNLRFCSLRIDDNSIVSKSLHSKTNVQFFLCCDFHCILGLHFMNQTYDLCVIYAILDQLSCRNTMLVWSRRQVMGMKMSYLWRWAESKSARCNRIHPRDPNLRCWTIKSTANTDTALSAKQMEAKNSARQPVFRPLKSISFWIIHKEKSPVFSKVARL